MTQMKRSSLRIQDGTKLSYLEGGSGFPLIMVHGWSQSAQMFSAQFEAFCKIRKVIALDWRGHGESQKTEYGYRICRFAKDLYDFVKEYGLTEFDILGHSLGTSALWSYMLMFGHDRPPRKLIFVDEPASLLARPNWSAQTRLDAGSIINSLEALARFTDSVIHADSVAKHADILRPMFTAEFPEDKLLSVAAENLKLPRMCAAGLLEDNCLHDWRSVVGQIQNPVLVVAAEGSPHPLESQQWIASQISGAKLVVIPKDEGGSHFMFVENPHRFNGSVLEFLETS